mmetsp:Transcript_34739/g.104705  ORF Transcript_34739/g.104705 Transcript_34739/m.104705 type:complete len:469 (+) Transcript_34739:3-1409(+)
MVWPPVGVGVSTATVVVERPDRNTPWGIDFQTITDVSGKPQHKVSAVVTGEPVSRRLRVGDLLVSVNGAAAPSHYGQVMFLLNAEVRLVLRVARVATPAAVTPRAAQTSPTGKRSKASPALLKFRAVANLVRMGVHIKVVRREAKVKASAVLITKKKKKAANGFTFVTDPDGSHRITSVDKDSPAARTHLAVGDYLAKINDTSVKGLSNSEVNGLLRNRKKALSIEIERSFDTAHVREIHVELLRIGGGGLGVTLGSSHFDEHSVVSVKPKSPADGKVWPNDIIEAVNGVSTEGLDHDHLVELLAQRNPTRLKLHRWLKDNEIEQLKSRRASTARRVVKLQLPSPQHPVGFTVQTFSTGDHRVVEVEHGTAAEGRLHHMDRINSVNGVAVAAVSHAEMLGILRDAGTVLTLEVESEVAHVYEHLDLNGTALTAVCRGTGVAQGSGFDGVCKGRVNLEVKEGGQFILYC